MWPSYILVYCYRFSPTRCYVKSASSSMKPPAGLHPPPHETSSGFSPPSATKIRRIGHAALSGVDRTPYTTRHKKMSFVTYHTQRISKNIVHCDATATLLRRSIVKARFSNILGSWRNGGS